MTEVTFYQVFRCVNIRVKIVVESGIKNAKTWHQHDKNLSIIIIARKIKRFQNVIRNYLQRKSGAKPKKTQPKMNIVSTNKLYACYCF